MKRTKQNTHDKDESPWELWFILTLSICGIIIGMIFSMPIVVLLFKLPAVLGGIAFAVMVVAVLFAIAHVSYTDYSFEGKLFFALIIIGIFVGSPIVYQQMQTQAQASLLLPTQYISASLFPLASYNFPFPAITIYTASVQPNGTACIGGGHMLISSFNYTTQTNTYANKTLNNTQVLKAYQAASGEVWPSSSNPDDAIQMLPGRTLLCPNMR